MTRVGVVGALEPEIRAFVLGSPRRSGKRARRDALIAVCGMGQERAYRAGERLIQQGATALVSWGTAAALVPTLRPGTLVLPEKIVDGRGRAFEVDAAWQRRVRARLPENLPVYMGALAEATEPLLTVADKSSLAQRSGAAAADMESAALAALALEAHIPLLVVRAVVDSAEMSVSRELAEATRSDGSLRVASTIARLAFSPRQWGMALRLACGFRAALGTLERIADEVHA